MRSKILKQSARDRDGEEEGRRSWITDDEDDDDDEDDGAEEDEDEEDDEEEEDEEDEDEAATNSASVDARMQPCRWAWRSDLGSRRQRLRRAGLGVSSPFDETPFVDVGDENPSTSWGSGKMAVDIFSLHHAPRLELQSSVPVELSSLHTQ
jgi:hypothetical protein